MASPAGWGAAEGGGSPIAHDGRSGGDVAATWGASGAGGAARQVGVNGGGHGGSRAQMDNGRKGSIDRTGVN